MNSYNASAIEVLKGLQAVRKRPGMYIGSTGAKGLHHLAWEIIDNSIDEVLNNFCNKIEVIIYKDGSISIEDNGRGIPIEKHKSGRFAPEIIFTELHSGGKFNNQNYQYAGGLHGVGASVVNALSSKLLVNIYKNKKEYEISFVNGGELKQPLIAKKATRKQGTFIRFWPDESIFSTTEFSFEKVSLKLKEKAFLINNLELTLIDERINKKEIYFYENGLIDYLNEINKGNVQISKPISFKEGGEISINFAFQYTNNGYEVIHSFVNNIKTSDGGTHELGMKNAFTKVINEFTQKHSLFKKRFLGDDIREGLTAIISIKVPEKILEFEGQTKSKLGSTQVRSIMEDFINKKLQSFLEENRDQSLKIINHIIDVYKGKEAARKARKNLKETKKKLGLEISLTGKLTPAQSKDKNKIELFLVEGDSAGGSAKQARDRKIQAILPLKGKILNVEKMPLSKVVQNDEIITIINVVGAGLGTSFDAKKVKYNKIIIMTDADTDGAHIQSLLLTFFYRYMVDLIQDKKIFIAHPPLYKIYNSKKIAYAWNEEELDKIKKDFPNYKIQRYKGLGEMNPDQLWETTMDPAKRKLFLVNFEDRFLAEEQVITLMGNDIEKRKKWIIDNIKFTLEEQVQGALNE